MVPAKDDLAEALLQLCEDWGLRQRFSAAGRAKAEREDWQPIFDALETRYRRLIAGHARCRSLAAKWGTTPRLARADGWCPRSWQALGSLFG